MDKNEIIQILYDWNFWKKEQRTGIVRKLYLDRLHGLLSTNQVITVTGPRRAGKSFLMRQKAKQLIESGVKREDILIVNFEDPRFTENRASLLAQIFEAYREFINPTAEPFIFLDEVQEIEGWEKWVRMMHELGKAKIIISGSNAKLLSRELGTLLTGRHLDLQVFPLSFGEFLEFNGVRIQGNLDIVSQETEVRGLFRRYLEYGSFPEVALSTQKKEILLNYFEDFVHKDLLHRFKIRKPQDLRALVKYCLSNTSTLATFNSFERALKISSTTAEKFAGYLEQAYLVFMLKRFSYKVREQEKSPRKVYAVDTGLCNAVGFRFSENSGRLAENIVFIALKSMQALDPQIELFYWKDEHHREVDFVVKDNLEVKSLIQVCWNLSDERTRDRETRSLAKAMREFKLDKALVLTEEVESEETAHGRTIQFLPLWKWLLGQL